MGAYLILFLKKRGLEGMAVGAIATLFFCAAAFFNYQTQNQNFIKWLSPDENANYVFAKHYAETDSFIIEDKDNLYVSDIIHPRSFRSDWGELKPMSFLGLPLFYGTIAHFTSINIIPYLTPLFASFSLIFYYLLCRRLFNTRVAILSVIILASFPVYLYYSTRSMFHNVLFVDFLLAGLYFAHASASLKLGKWHFFGFDWRGLSLAALGGLMFGFALITRASEALWVLPFLGVLWIFNARRIGILKPAMFLIFFIAPFIAIFYWNTILYGSFWFGGYAEMNQSLSNIKGAGESVGWRFWKNQETLMAAFEILKQNVFYFGFSSFQSIKTFFAYFPALFWWIFWPAVFGASIIASNWREQKYAVKIFTFSAILTSLILVFYYGSWQFHDNPDTTKTTIGNSYTRYWLPIYLAAIPLASLFFEKLVLGLWDKSKKDIIAEKKSVFYRAGNVNAALSSIAREKKGADLRKYIPSLKWPRRSLIENAILSLIIGSMVVFSLNFVLFGQDEGLIYSALKQELSKQEFETILNLTPRGAVIVTRYHDKLFYPERRVIVGEFNDKNMIGAYAKLMRRAPVYYYNFTLPRESLKYLNERKLAEFNVQLNKIKTLGVFTLYEFESARGKMCFFADNTRNKQ